MIANDLELQATQERSALFYQIVANIRAKVRIPAEYHLYINSYLAEIEKMNTEVLAYLKRHPSDPVSTEAA